MILKSAALENSESTQSSSVTLFVSLPFNQPHYWQTVTCVLFLPTKKILFSFLVLIK